MTSPNSLRSAVPDGADDCTSRPSESSDAGSLASPRPHETGRMLQTLLGNLDGMVYRCRDDADWTMEFVSEGCMRVTGYTPDDLLLNGRVSYEEITHPEDRERVRRAIHEALAARNRFEIEYRIVHADGK